MIMQRKKKKKTIKFMIDRMMFLLNVVKKKFFVINLLEKFNPFDVLYILYIFFYDHIKYK